jgi:cell pole-organizing protein PopZ
MSQSAKAQEPSMEEILASIRRIIADDDSSKPPAKPAAPPAPPPAAAAPRPAALPPRTPVTPPPAPPPRPVVAAPPPQPAPSASMNQQDVDAVLAGLDPRPAPHPEPQDDVLDLTESMATPGPGNSSPSFQTIDGQPDVVFADAPTPLPEPQPAPPPLPVSRMAEEPRRPAAQSTQNAAPAIALMSNSTSAAVDSAFNTLAQTVLVQNARTLEDLVREMLRPMLKSWLDDNLPGMVERIVRAEIERVSRGRS